MPIITKALRHIVLMLVPMGALVLSACGQAEQTSNKATTKNAASAYYVTLQGSGAVEQLPTAQLITDLPSAHYVALSADQTRLLVSSAKTPYVYLVDVSGGNKLARFDVGDTPQGVAISPDGSIGLAVGAADGVVVVINMHQAKVIKTLTVGKKPHNVRFTADGARAYVTLQGEGKVAVIDVKQRQVINEFATPGIDYPHNLDLSADGKVLWIRGFASKVAAVRLADKKVLAVIPVGASHAGIDVIPHSHYVATGAIGGDSVNIIDAKNFKVVRKIKVGQGSHGIRANRDGSRLFVTVTASNRVAVIDTHSWTVIKTIPTQGKVPFWVVAPGND